MGVISDGSYGAPPDVIFSYPVSIKNKQWTIVQGLAIDDFSKGKIEQTGQELVEERQEALAVCEDWLESETKGSNGNRKPSLSRL